MKVTNKLAMALALALASSSALALGLGPIRVKSALNEPLRAEIPITAATPEELAGLKVSLASSAAFERLGLDRSQFTVPLEFKVVKKPDGKTVIAVTTEQPVSDPALDFLIAVNWPQGRLLREYAVLLDPPNLAPSVAAAPSQPEAQPTTGNTRAAKRPAAAPRGASTAPLAPTPTRAPTGTATQAGSVRVQRGDTLWEIAHTHAPAGIGVDRMMEALRRGNPDAFYQDNINALKSGAVLRIPDREALAAIDPAAARASVHAQNERWANVQASAPMRVSRAGGRPVPAVPGGDAAASDAHLALVPPSQGGDSATSRAGVRGGSGDVNVKSLRQELANTKNALTSAQKQSDELQDRVKDLQDINSKNSRLISLKNDQIAELQRKLAEARAAAGQAAPAAGASVASAAPATAASANTPSAAPAGSASVRDTIFGSESGASAAAPAAAGSLAAMPAASVASPATAGTAGAALAQTPAAAATAATEASEPVAPVATTPSESLNQPWYMQNWVKWLIGLLIVALIALGLMKSRRKPGPVLVDDEPPVDAAVGAPAALGAEDEEDALIAELEQRPDDLATHLELASLYYAQREPQKFEAEAEAMYAHVDNPQVEEWQQVVAMGEELCPDSPLFAGLAGAAQGHEDIDTDEDIAVSDTGGPTGEEPDLPFHPAAPDAPDVETTASAAEDDGYSFDFNLTPGSASADAGQGEPSAPGEAADEAAPGGSEPQALDEESVDSGFGIASTPAADEADSGFGGGDEAADHGFSDDPVDTKLDLARAYQDMGDAEGARAMLDEVLQEGNEAQKDTARKLLDELG
ncbi:MAG TPA: FimV/HubP family polar landmark protein [Rhodanobacteraceae bacterium]|nr:FimV/HubP family polar landmark protein [Rhodanobacteraceae bacterium]